MKKTLWTWSWMSGGWNQCYARSLLEAYERAEKIGKGVLIPNADTLRPAPPLKMYKEKLLETRGKIDE